MNKPIVGITMGDPAGSGPEYERLAGQVAGHAG